MKKIKIVLIGAGFIADYHARALQLLPEVEIAGVVGLPIEAVKGFANKYNIHNVSTDYKDFLKNKEIDAVIISTPNKFHAPIAIDFLKEGIDVFLEKPMAVNPKEGEKITRDAKENNRIVMIGHMWRFDEEVNFIKNLIDSGKLGKIIKTKGYGIHENWGPGGWFTKKEIAGGGALADMGVHAIDTVRYILGDPDPTEVYAKIGTYFGNYDVDDSGIIIISWDNGTTSIIESGWWQPHMDGPEASTQFFGTKGYATVLPTAVKLKSEEKIEIPSINKSEHCDQSIYSKQMEKFVESIKSRIQPNPGYIEGQKVLEIVDAAYQSSELGKVVKF
ncbi:MAG: Gfo/Idh/MocA family oxidoreductase [Ignavibacteriae bacterium]|nr:Gfo/Idh/MocA family oxidoreductase [Ignavibacteriota bacterium]